MPGLADGHTPSIAPAETAGLAPARACFCIKAWGAMPIDSYLPFTVPIAEVEVLPGTAETLVRRRITHEVLLVLGAETFPDGRAFLWVRPADEADQDRAQWMVQLSRDYQDGLTR